MMSKEWNLINWIRNVSKCLSFYSIPLAIARITHHLSNSKPFCKSRQNLQQTANSTSPLEIPWPAQNWDVIISHIITTWCYNVTMSQTENTRLLCRLLYTTYLSTTLPSRTLLFFQAGSHLYQGQSGISSMWLHDSSHGVMGQCHALISDSAPQNQWTDVELDSQHGGSWLFPSFRSSGAASGREHDQMTKITNQHISSK